MRYCEGIADVGGFSDVNLVGIGKIIDDRDYFIGQSLIIELDICIGNIHHPPLFVIE